VTLRDEVERVISEGAGVTERDDFRRLSDFYEEMKRQGAVLRKTYDLPTLDTVGRNLNSGPGAKPVEKRPSRAPLSVDGKH
jgi:hypothetical protein